MNKVITIGRQFGSGGCEIGRRLAEKLGIEYYDKNLIEIVAEKSGISKKMFEDADEKHNSFLYSLSMAHYGGLASPIYLNDVVTQDKLFLIQANIIKELAEKPCVIVGRCADDILKNYCKRLSVFVHADMPFRVDRISKLYDIKEQSAETLIKKTDKNRKNYYDFYAHAVWGAASSYDMTIASDIFGIDNTVEVLANCAEKFFE